MKDRLKTMRKALGLKQREVAERLGINVGQVGAWECGKERIPPARVYQLCKEYNVRREWLETGDGEMFEPNDSKEKAQEEFVAEIFQRLTADQQERILKALRKCVASQDQKTISPIVNVNENNGTINQFNK